MSLDLPYLSAVDDKMSPQGCIKSKKMKHQFIHKCSKSFYQIEPKRSLGIIFNGLYLWVFSLFFFLLGKDNTLSISLIANQFVLDGLLLLFFFSLHLSIFFILIHNSFMWLAAF